jgi:hypothetical protein
MSSQSLGTPTGIVSGQFGTPIWESREKEPFGCSLREVTQREPQSGKEVAAPSIIREIHKIHGREDMPPDGGIILAQNVHVKPLVSKTTLNAILILRVLGGSLRSNGFPRGHADLNGGHPGLGENLLERVVLSEVFPTSFRPKVVKNKTTEDVEGLPGVGETPLVVREEPMRVVLMFDGRFSEKDKGPSDVDVGRGLPFVPHTFEGFPSVLHRGAFH